MPVSGQDLTGNRPSGTLTDVSSVPLDLVQHVAATTGLPESTAARVVSDVIGYFAETTEQFVRRRHAELHKSARHGHTTHGHTPHGHTKHGRMKNDQIWDVIASELAARPVAAAPVSPRQLRRMVYG